MRAPQVYPSVSAFQTWSVHSVHPQYVLGSDVSTRPSQTAGSQAGPHELGNSSPAIRLQACSSESPVDSRKEMRAPHVKPSGPTAVFRMVSEQSLQPHLCALATETRLVAASSKNGKVKNFMPTANAFLSRGVLCVVVCNSNNNLKIVSRLSSRKVAADVQLVRPWTLLGLARVLRAAEVCYTYNSGLVVYAAIALFGTLRVFRGVWRR